MKACPKLQISNIPEEPWVSKPVVLIPAYRPDAALLPLCRELKEAGFPVLVIDDGSGDSFQTLFEKVERVGCIALHHPANLGKGRALKTGIGAALQRFAGLPVITADADGQHTASDIRRIATAMRDHPKALVIGTRRFTKGAPLKSRAGNAITRYVYRRVTGIRCRDTQSGLRGIPGSALPRVLRLPGERYEFEMHMLLSLHALSLPLYEVDIQTIYTDGNRSSHFRPLSDSIRVCSAILRYALGRV